MNTRLYVNNLSATITYNDLMDLFSAHGNVAEVNLPVDRANGQPRGFGFVTMATPEVARAAIQALHAKEVGTQILTVSESGPHEAHAGLSVGGRSPRRRSSYLFWVCQQPDENLTESELPIRDKNSNPAAPHYEFHRPAIAKVL